MDPHLLFVYGTLRRGGPWHDVLHGTALPLGAARTRDRYALFRVGGLPMASEAHCLHQVVGEVYAVGDRGLALVDQLEQHPHWYRRAQVPVLVELFASLEDLHPTLRELRAWCYFIRPEHLPVDAVLCPGGEYLAPARVENQPAGA